MDQETFDSILHPKGDPYEYLEVRVHKRVGGSLLASPSWVLGEKRFPMFDWDDEMNELTKLGIFVALRLYKEGGGDSFEFQREALRWIKADPSLLEQSIQTWPKAT